MSAPASSNIHNLNGSWAMDKKLSDSIDPILELQGIPWIVRKAVSWATITGTITQTKDEKGRTIIRVEQTATGGLKAETETVQLDGSEQVHESAVFGSQRVRSRWLDLTSERPAPGVSSKEEIDPYLGEGWLQEEPEGSPGHVWVTATNERAGWRVDQVWGFALVDGQRYHIKKFVATKGEGRVTARMVYAWVRA
ncbi:uncharacterized protein P884DRAFT_251482 [Thermothelomyces heterothallicus CBS 202.75]|uniref:uncharacterized protein n=1 Tax=Thermothelomyces heterothallicus CBS 202.75 TaxID=1149848 RepID=UPI0037429572